MPFYTVQPHDRPSLIAQRLGLSGVEVLLAHNPSKPIVRLVDGSATFQSLNVGERLNVPPGLGRLGAIDPFFQRMNAVNDTFPHAARHAKNPKTHDAVIQAAAHFFHELHPTRTATSITPVEAGDFLTTADSWIGTVREEVPYTQAVSLVHATLPTSQQIASSAWSRAAFSMATKFYLQHDPVATLPAVGMPPSAAQTLTQYIRIADSFYLANRQLLQQICPDGQKLSDGNNPLSACIPSNPHPGPGPQLNPGTILGPGVSPNPLNPALLNPHVIVPYVAPCAPGSYRANPSDPNSPCLSLVIPPIEPDFPPIETCPPGQYYNLMAGGCIPVTCPPGSAWDPASLICRLLPPPSGTSSGETGETVTASTGVSSNTGLFIGGAIVATAAALVYYTVNQPAPRRTRR